ncbi:MAG TPA: hypothetical protein VEU29_08540 [Actinomycetota bacterium]|nr:hypothetical protein [Actinomycetota bacterium]
MIYLLIMFLVAGTGLASLWVQQRRARAHLETVDGFRSSLEKLSKTPAVARPRRRPTAAPRAAAPRRAASTSPGRRGAPTHRSSRNALDPERRAAARKRIEARRRAASRSRSF